MHGLNQIKSQNEQQAADNFSIETQRLRAEGYSYRVARDAVTNKPDHTATIDVFTTAFELKANTLATIPAHSIGNYEFFYGSN
jgi:hypothetical protein